MHMGYFRFVYRQELAVQCVPALVDWGACEELETAARAGHVATMLEKLSQDKQRSAKVREGCVQAVWLGCLKPQVIGGDLAVAKRALPLLLQLARRVCRPLHPSSLENTTQPGPFQNYKRVQCHGALTLSNFLSKGGHSARKPVEHMTIPPVEQMTINRVPEYRTTVIRGRSILRRRTIAGVAAGSSLWPSRASGNAPRFAR